MLSGSEGARFGPNGSCSNARSRCRLCLLFRRRHLRETLQHAYISDTAAVIVPLPARAPPLQPRAMQHAVAPSLLCKLCRGSVAVFAASTRSRPRYATLSAAASTSQSPGTSQRRARQRPVIRRSIHASAEKARYRQPAVLEANSDVEGRAATDALSTPRVRNLKELYDTSGKKKRPILYNNETAKTVAGKIRQGARRLTVVDLYAGVQNAFRLVSSSRERLQQQCQILIQRLYPSRHLHCLTAPPPLFRPRLVDSTRLGVESLAGESECRDRSCV